MRNVGGVGIICAQPGDTLGDNRFGIRGACYPTSNGVTAGKIRGELKTAQGAWWNTLNLGLTTPKATGGLSKMVSLDLIAAGPPRVTPEVY